MAGQSPRWSDILAMAQAAEVVGFDAVWVSDHFGFGDPVIDTPPPGANNRRDQ
jgi:alkanesulfonate monooxygenase SsuD/methylene tetrahydromethanopterin reductase-like flavin-dependent oxidoreductase (luciferase family)